MPLYSVDLHIHSALSPCAADEMTPLNIAAVASVQGLDMIAVADHNSIKNVPAVMAAGEAFGVAVVPAFELQTSEDLHLLCLFPSYAALSDFYNQIKFTDLKNKEEVYGRQQIFDAEGEPDGCEESLLINSAEISESEARPLAQSCGGIAVPAHINRGGFGMVEILGAVPTEYTAVETSGSCGIDVGAFTKGCKILNDSDAHELKDIGKYAGKIELSSATPEALIAWLCAKE